ncbi:hypothetical protein DFH06DRAFT_1371176 [Mycena polygramma]|nr:hypothetical protein DFH06DRAFT_1371176 [Mycena polygramma]
MELTPSAFYLATSYPVIFLFSISSGWDGSPRRENETKNSIQFEFMVQQFRHRGAPTSHKKSASDARTAEECLGFRATSGGSVSREKLRAGEAEATRRSPPVGDLPRIQTEGRQRALERAAPPDFIRDTHPDSEGLRSVRIGTSSVEAANAVTS